MPERVCKGWLLQAGGPTKPSQGPVDVENILLHVPLPSHRSVAPFLSHLPWRSPTWVGIADLFHRAPYRANRLRLLRPVEHPRRLCMGHQRHSQGHGCQRVDRVPGGRFHPFLTHYKYPACHGSFQSFPLIPFTCSMMGVWIS
jgi:hypothetical protein